ncbi:MAG: hypothetical protein ABJD13_12610 [Paracoccaceae bacterium]
MGKGVKARIWSSKTVMPNRVDELVGHLDNRGSTKRGCALD